MMRPPPDEPDLTRVEPALKLAAPLEFTFAGHQGARMAGMGQENYRLRRLDSLRRARLGFGLFLPHHPSGP